MRRFLLDWRLPAAACFCLAAVVPPALAQTSTSSTEVKQFEVVSVNGNKIVARTAAGAKEYTVTDDFQFTVDGKPVTVRELKPGMKGTARVTTTTTTTPVYVTEVRNGEVMQASGSSVIIRGPNGIRMFTEGDLAKRNVTVLRDGQPANLTDFRAGDRLTATIVTEGPPKVMTERQVQAAISGAAPGATASGAAASRSAASGTAASGAAAPAGTTTADARTTRTLPKTASARPLFGLAGVVLLAAAAALTIARRRRASIL
jgi:LPXTG-motif cell wall-anchored protein